MKVFFLFRNSALNLAYSSSDTNAVLIDRLLLICSFECQEKFVPQAQRPEFFCFDNFLQV